MLVVPADSKEGADSDLDKYLPEADVVITTPFHPGYINAERLKKAPKLKLALTAGIGSDHVDLKAAAENGVTVAEITGEFSNTRLHLMHCPELLHRQIMLQLVVNSQWGFASVHDAILLYVTSVCFSNCIMQVHTADVSYCKWSCKQIVHVCCWGVLAKSDDKET